MYALILVSVYVIYSKDLHKKYVKKYSQTILCNFHIVPRKQVPRHHPSPYGLHIRRTGHKPIRGPSAGWRVLTTANAAGTNDLTCLPNHWGAPDNKFLVTHPMIDQSCLTSAIARTEHRATELLLDKFLVISKYSLALAEFKLNILFLFF
jgi:hypothetical protein